MSASDSDDNFGNFSDASFENEELQTESNIVNTCLDEYFGSEPETEDSTISDDTIYKVDDLINGGRSAIIYEQLVKLQSVLQPIIWNKSALRHDLLHKLRIREDDDDDDYDILELNQYGSPIKGRRKSHTGYHSSSTGDDEVLPLDDRLFTKILTLINDDAMMLSNDSHPLKETFKMKYVPNLAPQILQNEWLNEQEKQIPSLISKDFKDLEDMNQSDLQEYRDQLCNSIDVLCIKLQEINDKRQILNADKSIYENVITNLTGHTQRLYRTQLENYNKKKSKSKEKKKKKFGWVGV